MSQPMPIPPVPAKLTGRQVATAVAVALLAALAVGLLAEWVVRRQARALEAELGDYLALRDEFRAYLEARDNGQAPAPRAPRARARKTSEGKSGGQDD